RRSWNEKAVAVPAIVIRFAQSWSLIARHKAVRFSSNSSPVPSGTMGCTNAHVLFPCHDSTEPNPSRRMRKCNVLIHNSLDLYQASLLRSQNWTKDRLLHF